MILHPSMEAAMCPDGQEGDGWVLLLDGVQVAAGPWSQMVSLVDEWERWQAAAWRAMMSPQLPFPAEAVA